MDDGSDEDKWDGAQTNELNHEVQTDHFKSGDLKGIDLRTLASRQRDRERIASPDYGNTFRHFNEDETLPHKQKI